MKFVAAFAVWVACKGFGVNLPARCVNEFLDCTNKKNTSIKSCKHQVLKKYEPKKGKKK